MIVPCVISAIGIGICLAVCTNVNNNYRVRSKDDTIARDVIQYYDVTNNLKDSRDEWREKKRHDETYPFI